jgi:hypothetical protein
LAFHLGRRDSQMDLATRAAADDVAPHVRLNGDGGLGSIGTTSFPFTYTRPSRTSLNIEPKRLSQTERGTPSTARGRSAWGLGASLGTAVTALSSLLAASSV